MDSKSCLACSYNGPELQRFPRDKKRMIQWLEAVNRKDLLEKKDFYMDVYTKGRLCNSHFNEWCFDAENKKKLMKYAIPVQNQPNTAKPNNVTLPLKAIDKQKVKEEKKDVIPKSSDEVLKHLNNSNRPEAYDESGNNEIIENREEKEAKKDEFTGGGQNVTENKEECKSGGLEHNFEIERIIGATDVLGDELMFLIKWKDCTVTELLPARIINEKYPQDVIKFYEGRLIWREAQCENS